MNTAPIVSKVLSFCTTLRADGDSYEDYLEQLTAMTVHGKQYRWPG